MGDEIGCNSGILIKIRNSSNSFRSSYGTQTGNLSTVRSKLIQASNTIGTNLRDCVK